MPIQRLILLFDGTWNDPQDMTNVHRLCQLIHKYDGDIKQEGLYDTGVGASKFQRIRGGAFGYGLSENLLEGYQKLAARYNQGDEIWVFGFSRGAYTARSLVGLIRKCGLLRNATPKLLDEAERIYRNKELEPDHPICKAFRENHSRTPRIRFIGVWDTVGALGIPGTNFSEKGKYSWHDTELSGIVDYAYHAVALDENRAAYDVALWTSPDGKKKPENTEVEQRWFIGAHSNVGGGYGKQDLLPDIPLSWMIQKASDAGLKLEAFSIKQDAWMSEPTDSFKEFMKGAYALFRRVTTKGDGRFYRKYSEVKKESATVNVVVDESVWKRWKHPKFNYRPRTLVDASQSPPSP